MNRLSQRLSHSVYTFILLLKQGYQPALKQRNLHFILVKCVGIIYFIALVSLLMQVKGLYGSDGILPINNQLQWFESNNISWLRVPHILWSGDTLVLQVTLGFGLLASLCLIIGFVPFVSLGICWLVYLSFINTGSIFMSFQWDILLVDISVLLLLAVPHKWFWHYSDDYCPPKLIILALRVFCARLIITSGWSKLASGDLWWRELRALDVHYFTQPLPHQLSWFFHQLPVLFQRLSVAVMLMVECLVPIGIFFTQRFRYGAGLLIIGLMTLIMLSGNFCFFNLLTIVLSAYVFDDLILKKWQHNLTNVKSKRTHWLAPSLAICLMFVTCTDDILRFIAPKYHQLLRQITYKQTGFRLINNYGLFATMTTTRNEIEIWGSLDQKTWKPYVFKYKPNSIKDAPRWTWFHQPRLDWQLWFVALRGYSDQSWINQLATKLFQASPDVEALFEYVPFENGPTYLMFTQTPYTFSNWDQLYHSGHWWVTGKRRPFSPVYKKPK